MLTSLFHLDKQITLFLYHLIPHYAFFDSFFAFLSGVGNSFFLWALIIAALFFFEEQRNKWFIVYFAISFAVTVIFVNIILKNYSQRPRPPIYAKATTVFACPADYSFPSGHASAAFASAVILAAFDRKRKLYYYLIAVFISYSRIYLGCHYFLDVIGGGIIGASISNLTLHLLSKPIRLSSQKK